MLSLTTVHYTGPGTDGGSDLCVPLTLNLWPLQDGTLSVGDQLVSVDGRSLVGLNQER